MTMIEYVFALIRIAMYFFTSASMILAAIAVFKPMSITGEQRKVKAILFLCFSVLFMVYGIATILKITGNPIAGTWVINFPITIIMIISCIFSWRFIVETSRIVSEDGMAYNSK